MSFTDPIGDMIARIRNGQMRSHVKVEMPASSFKGKILEVLKKEGFILNYTLELTDEKKTKFSIELKYHLAIPNSCYHISYRICKTHIFLSFLPT